MHRRIAAIALGIVAASAGLSCAVPGGCGFRGCPGDAAVSARVWAVLARYSAAQPPNLVHVQTLNRVVFLRGQVDTDSERLTLEQAARGVDGVTRVVDLISLGYEGR
jgi:osmotically-inducible protein OsmY